MLTPEGVIMASTHFALSTQERRFSQIIQTRSTATLTTINGYNPAATAVPPHGPATPLLSMLSPSRRVPREPGMQFSLLLADMNNPLVGWVGVTFQLLLRSTASSRTKGLTAADAQRPRALASC